MNLSGRSIHFMGAGGIGVSALAELAVHAGAVVTACDREENEMTARLRAVGVDVVVGHDAAHAENCERFVHTAAVPPDHPERVAAEKRGVAVRRGSFLAELMRGRDCVGVAGAHGKTTTTCLLGQLLVGAGCDPTVLLGGLPAGSATNVRVGGSDLFVTELDESDGSFLEPDLRVGVVTNVEADHLDHYGTAEAVVDAYHAFAADLGGGDTLVLGGDDGGATSLTAERGGRVVRAGVSDGCDVRGVEMRPDGMICVFGVVEDGTDRGHVRLPLPGLHNVRNALCALAAARACGAEWDALRETLPTCVGVARRFEIVGERNGVTVVDDYAHHPTEVAAALATARQVHDGRIVAVFQPHLYSRTHFLCREFGEALAAADVVALADIYPAREAPLPGVTSALVIDAVRAQNAEALGPWPRERVAEETARLVRPGDMVLFLGAGSITVCAREFLEHC